jgi:hypothetical protein
MIDLDQATASLVLRDHENPDIRFFSVTAPKSDTTRNLSYGSGVT